MNESRRKEIEGIIQRLKDIQSQLRQIRVADSVAKNPPDPKLHHAIQNIEHGTNCLDASLL